MQKILVLGAGKSSSILISHLAKQSGIELCVADMSEDNLKLRTSSLSSVKTFWGDISDGQVLASLVQSYDIMVSLLPPHLHIVVAQLCLKFGKHFLTASYVNPEILSLDQEAQGKGLLFLMECGLDPGIDHMSAMELLDRIKEQGGEVSSFRSYCGGLVAPESDDNPWGYKITWNPRNVVLAGQGTAKFAEGGKIKYLPYHQLFKRTVPLIFDQFGEYEAYANRDSLTYIPQYGLEGISTFIRGTIRKKGYCEAWDHLVQLGLTDNSVKINGAMNVSMNQLLKSFLPEDVSLASYLNVSEQSESFQKLIWLGINDSTKPVEVQNPEPTPADFLQTLIERKWKLNEGDKDLVLMQHLIEYEVQQKKYTQVSTLAVLGEDLVTTAMAKTVGLPLAICVMLLVEGKIKSKGVQTPIKREFYVPVLESLHKLGIVFKEKSYS